MGIEQPRFARPAPMAPELGAAPPQGGMDPLLLIAQLMQQGGGQQGNLMDMLVKMQPPPQAGYAPPQMPVQPMPPMQMPQPMAPPSPFGPVARPAPYDPRRMALQGAQQGMMGGRMGPVRGGSAFGGL